MSYAEAIKNIMNDFLNILDEKSIIINKKDIIEYSSDKTEDFVFTPDIVIIPDNTKQISNIMKICNNNKIPVTVRGTGTGLSGGALPIIGGVLLSMEKFNKILEIDKENFTITVEPFVINYEIQKAAKKNGLFYPPDPANYKFCSIGGNIAENSGGPKAVKYGTTKDYVMSLEVVLPNGDIIITGKNLIKDVAGYNLTQLFIGSEGTLGIITKATLKLIPDVKHDILLLASFHTVEDAGRAVNTILNTGIIPSALELMERNALLISKEHGKFSFPPVNEKTQAHLIIELDGNDFDKLITERDIIINEIKENNNPEFILLSTSDEEKENIWQLRRHTGTAIGETDTFKEEDISVPRAKIPEAIKYIKEWAEKYNFKVAIYGHAGDGNIHTNILRANASDDVWNHQLTEHLKELFNHICNNLNGSVTGEHGIGYTQREYLKIMLDDNTYNLMKNIKNLFDLNGILNPEKIF